MWKGLYVLVGVAIAPVVKAVFRDVGRPLAKQTVRFGLRAADRIQELAHEVREDLEDLSAEARAELKREAETAEKQQKEA